MVGEISDEDLSVRVGQLTMTSKFSVTKRRLEGMLLEMYSANNITDCAARQDLRKRAIASLVSKGYFPNDQGSAYVNEANRNRPAIPNPAKSLEMKDGRDIAGAEDLVYDD